MFGDRDYQITAEDRITWESVVDGAGPEGGALVRAPACNHYLIPGEGPPDPSDHGREADLDAELMDTIAGWMHARFE